MFRCISFLQPLIPNAKMSESRPCATSYQEMQMVTAFIDIYTDCYSIYPVVTFVTNCKFFKTYFVATGTVNFK